MPNLGQYWPKRAIFQISPKNQSRNIFWTAEARLPAKKLGNSNAQFSKNDKTPIFGYFGQKKADSVKKRKRHFFTHFFHFSKQKIRKF